MESRPTKDNRHPSLELSHEFVLPSYNWMLNRLSAVEGRIHNLLALCITLTAFFPVVVLGLQGKSEYLNGSLSICAFFCFALVLAIGLVARAVGSVRLIDPSTMDHGWTTLSKQEFFKYSIEDAGKTFKRNQDLIARKSLATDIATGVFAVEIVLWAIWGWRVLGS